VKFRNTVILVVVFAALLAYFLVLEEDQNPASPTGTPTPTSTNVFTFASNEVVELNLTDGTKTTTLQRDNDTAPWKIVAPSANPGDSVRINGVVQQLSSLTASRVFTDSASLGDLAAFGLAKPKVNATVKLKDGKQYALSIGDKTPDSSNAYVQKPDDKSIYLVNGTLADDASGMVDAPPVAPPTPTPTATATLTSTVAVTTTAPVTATPSAPNSSPVTATTGVTSPISVSAPVTTATTVGPTAAPVVTSTAPVTSAAEPVVTATAAITATTATPTIIVTPTAAITATLAVTTTP
jgi:hypothetical protein